MASVLNQKGANGIIAEYQCAFALHQLIAAKRLQVRSSASELKKLLLAKQAQFESELTHEQMMRAIRQGDALAQHVLECLHSRPTALILPKGFSCASYEYEVIPTGHMTIKDDSGDLLIKIFVSASGEAAFQCPISLKAYRGTTTSQGSKGGKAALTRLFLGKEKATDAEFVKIFGDDGKAFLEHIATFKQVAKEFYEKSREGRAFVEAYQARKGPGARVNNPLRRKELGNYFKKKTGMLSEHVLARLYVSMFNQGFSRIRSSGEFSNFSEAMKFVLGFDNEIVTLNAICLDNGPVTVENSVESGKHAKLREILRSLEEVNFSNKPNSSIISVDFKSAEDSLNLNLAIWKDGTIQFKMDSSRNG